MRSHPLCLVVLAASLLPASVRAQPVSFVNDVMPVLAKAGCNSGACHGAAAGKKGFKLSLRGYDPSADWVSLTHGTSGRRVNLNAPDLSLLLLKTTGAVPHEGGVRFQADSRYAGLLRQWIANGATFDGATAPKLVGLDVSPDVQNVPQPGVELPLRITARYSDGSTREVSADARCSSGNEQVAVVSEAGVVRLRHKGEAAVMVRYGDRMAVSRFVVLQHNPSFVWNNPPEQTYIDAAVFAKLKSMQVLPSDLCTDEEFLRRASYDVIGLPPTPAEVRAFLADTRTDKRARVIDELLGRPEHAEYWATKWGDLLRIRFDLLGDKGTWGLYRWLRDSIAANKPFDRLVGEVLTAEGSSAESPPANFWRVFNTPEEASEAAVQVFLGVRLLCARCHDHPFEKWVQKDYYGMSAFFTQVGRKAGRRGDQVVFRNEATPQARHPSTGEMLSPKYLDGDSIRVAADQDGRRVLADWLTRKDNPFLARATVNRLWSYLFGKGIIDPVDDIRSSNPPVNEPLLAALAKDFVEHDFDVRHLLRTMLNSRTYQLSARTNDFNRDDRENFSHRLPRRLTAEQLLDTLSQATEVREGFVSRYGAGAVALPAGGMRAGALPDRQLTAETLDLFGRPRGDTTCACERHEEASMTQALHLINGKSVTNRVSSLNGRVARLVKTPNITDAQIVEELYLAVLCRLPRPHEVELMKRHFAEAGERLQAAQDVMWALLNSKEFLFNY